jgi:hypothetical protein
MLLNANHLCDIQRRYVKQKLTYSAGTGTPVVGQTIVGATSGKTAKIDVVASGYLVVEDLSGTFTPAETIRIGTSPSYTFTATLTAQTDYRRSTGEYEFYWTSDQTSVRCRIYLSGGGRGVVILMPGATVEVPLKVALPNTINATTLTATEYRIVTTETGWSGTYSIERLDTRGGMSVRVDHFEATVRKVL